MKNKKILQKKIKEEEDFIYCPRLSNSLENLLDKNPNGVDDERIKKVLLISDKELESLYNSALNKLRDALGVKRDE